MLQLIVYGLLLFLTLLAICDIIGSCLEKESSKKKMRLCSAPVYFIKNRLKGMRRLRDEPETAQSAPADDRPYNISETV